MTHDIRKIMNLMEDSNVIDLASRRNGNTTISLTQGTVSPEYYKDPHSTVRTFPKALTLRKTIINRFPELKNLSLTEDVVSKEDIIKVLKKCWVEKKLFDIALSKLSNKTWFTIGEASEAVGAAHDEIINNMGKFRRGIEMVLGDPVGPWLAFRNKIVDYATYPIALMFNVDKKYVYNIIYNSSIPQDAQDDIVYDLVRNVPEEYTIAKVAKKYNIKEIDLAIFYEVQLSYREPDLGELQESIGDFAKGLPVVRQILARNKEKLEAERLERQRKSIKNRSEGEWHELLILGVGYDKYPQPKNALTSEPYKMGSPEMDAWLQGFGNVFRFIKTVLKFDIDKGVGNIPRAYDSCVPNAFRVKCKNARLHYDAMYMENEAAKNPMSIAESIEKAIEEDKDEELDENILDNIPKMSMTKLRTKAKFKQKKKKW